MSRFVLLDDTYVLTPEEEASRVCLSKFLNYILKFYFVLFTIFVVYYLQNMDDKLDYLSRQEKCLLTDICKNSLLGPEICRICYTNDTLRMQHGVVF